MSCHCATRASLGGREFARPSAEDHYVPDLGLEPSHLEVALQFDVPAKRAQGSVTTTVVSRIRGRRKLTLSAVDFHQVAVSDPDGHGLEWSYDGEQIEVCWAKAPALGEQRRVEVSYAVQHPLTGMHFSVPDEAYPDAPLFLATDHETERARYWLPCVDHPTVRTTLEFALRADAQLTILANGLCTGEDAHDDGTKTAHWKLDYPCPSYLVCLAVGEFVRWRGEDFQELEVAAYAPPPFTPEDLERSFGRTTDMLCWLTEKLGAPFPFPKYFQLAVPGIGGAMENISLVTWDDVFVMDETLALEWTRLVDRINVHEMAHSYFGDAIVIRDFSHAWLKESWATYVEALWTEARYGQDEMHFLLSLEARDYCRESNSRYARPIVTRHFDSSWDMFDQHLYPGGAWRIHMLRQIVGEQAFWPAVQEYVATYSSRVVETDDFRRVLEKHSGRSLERFFDQWLRSPGHPKLKVSFSHDAEKGEARLEIEQTQRSKTKGIGLFHLDLTVALETEPGVWERHVVELSDARHVLIFPLAKRPQQVVIDPKTTVLHELEFDPGQDMLIRSLEECVHVSGRLHAVKTLAKSGKPRAVAQLHAAYGEEVFWGIRVAIAEALGDAKSQIAARALSELLTHELTHERDPMVLQHVARACGKYRDAEIARVLREMLGRDDVGYLARSAALESLGKQRGEEHLDLLEPALEDASWWGWVRRGGAAALGATRSKRACDLLAAKLGYGQDASQVRAAAAGALAEAASWQERGPREAAGELLADMTRDPVYRVRLAAGGALAGLASPGTSGALRGLEASVAGQDRPHVARLSSQARHAGIGQEATKLKKRVEELEESVRKLEKRVQTVEARKPNLS